MGHFRIAFWIFTLSVTLSCCHPVFLLSDSNIDLMKSDVKCPSDSTFYAPENVTEECLTSALTCVLVELNSTAKWECKDVNRRIGQAVRSLKRIVSNSSASQNSDSCLCESWPQQPFTEFLGKYKALLQLRNSLGSR